MKIFNQLKEHFRKKTPEQVFSFCLLVGCFMLMLFCAIVRLCGGLWFTADTSIIKEPSEFWQDVILAFLFVLEATFIYKLLCRTSWFISFIVSVIEIVVIYFCPNQLTKNILNLVCYFLIPFLFQRKWVVLLETLFVYLICNLYAILFLIGRIGFVNGKQAYDFITNILTTIDYKLFIVSLYLFFKNFGGVKLWKWKILVL
jgi:hypothetical protein